jgi:hypothetical protein
MGATPIAAWRPITPAVTATIGASSASTGAAPAGVHAALIQGTGDCHFRIGPPAQTAVSTDTLIRSAYPPLVFGVSPGEVVAVIQDATATGTLFVTWLTH